MMANCETPYRAFNFLVNICRSHEKDSTLGGFSEVSGIAAENIIAEYR
jgi:hypothetical protein